MTFADLLDRFPGLSALVVGDLMLDEYIYGKATRISPEAPVMVVRHDRTKRVPGGAANVAKNLLALGARTAVVGVIGGDEAGRLLGESLEPLGFSDVRLVEESDRQTTRKTRVLADSAHQVLRIDSEDEKPASESTCEQLHEMAKKLLHKADVLVLSDYLKGTLSRKLVGELIHEAVALEKTVVANPKPRSALWYKGAHLISMNRKEATEMLGIHPVLADAQAETAAGNLRDLLGSPVLITLGDSGMVAASPSRVCRISAPRVEVYDTAGAGDTVIATSALGIAVAGFDKTVFELAAHTAASVVRKIGVAVPSHEDITALRSLGYST